MSERNRVGAAYNRRNYLWCNAVLNCDTPDWTTWTTQCSSCALNEFAMKSVNYHICFEFDDAPAVTANRIFFRTSWYFCLFLFISPNVVWQFAFPGFMITLCCNLCNCRQKRYQISQLFVLLCVCADISTLINYTVVQFTGLSLAGRKPRISPEFIPQNIPTVLTYILVILTSATGPCNLPSQQSMRRLYDLYDELPIYWYISWSWYLKWMYIIVW